MSLNYTQNPYTTGLRAGSSVFGNNEGRKIALINSSLVGPSHGDSMVDKGDPVYCGNIVGVAMDSASATTDYIEVNTDAAYNLSVVPSDEAGTSDIAVGDIIYISSAGVLSKKSSGKPFGLALATATGSASATVIPVWVSTSVGARNGQYVKGQRFTVAYPNFAAADVAKAFWIAPAACRLIQARETHVTVAGQAGTLTIEKCNSGEAAAAGDVMLAAAWDLTSTANTPVTKAGNTDGTEKMVAGDMLRLKLASGAATSYANATLICEMEWM